MKYIWAVIGFLSLAIGLSSLILNSMGLELSYLFFLNNLEPLPQLLIHLFMIFGGVVAMYLNLVDWKKDETRELN